MAMTMVEMAVAPLVDFTQRRGAAFVAAARQPAGETMRPVATVGPGL
jgi:hypothetical protein